VIVVHAVRSDGFAGVERYVATIAPRLVARGIDVRVIGGDGLRKAIGGVVPFQFAPTRWRVAAALRATPADVVHAHMTDAEFAAAVATRRCPIVATRHFTGRRGKSRPGRVVSGFIRRRLAAQISISDVVANSIGEPSTRVYSGVEDRDAGGHEQQTVLMLQRLESEKDTDVALHAWARTRARTDGWSLEIAGEGKERPALEALMTALRINDSVRFLGYVTDAEERLARAGLLLATTPMEAFGFSVVEAMAAATPVVAAAGGGHLETVGSLPEARLFPIGDAEACAALIDQLVGDADGRRSYGRALQQVQRTKFAIDHHVESLIDLYARLA
jgi:glycosyltransferase involved in cell wall biosynthesis